MNPTFFQQVESILAPERLDAYRQDGAAPVVTLARYLWNMALCEALYSPLQIAEIALRNSLHGCLSARFGGDRWYDVIAALPAWQQRQLNEVRQKLLAEGKPVTPGRMVAELHFGFWTGFFNKSHARTGLGHALARLAFAHAPRPERDLKKLDARWRRIRDLRNRIFHHERIIHWKDLAAQHSSILQTIAWISPELHEIARALDRFTAIHQAGLTPWLDRIQRHWPNPSDLTTKPSHLPGIMIVPDTFDVTNGAETPFGHRWGGDVFLLSTEHFVALQAGHTLALDVQSEYIAFLKRAESAKPEQVIKANLRGLGYGG
jgi:hypothetical protein